MPNKYLEAGKITSISGIRGEVNVYPWCDSPELLCELDTLYWKSGEAVTVESARVRKNMAVLKLSGIDTPEQAQRLRNRILYIDREDIELEEGSYFLCDLMGMQVEDSRSGEVYGEIFDFTETGANDVYHIRTPKGRVLLIPAIPDVVDEVDIEGGVMKITPLEGLFDI